MPTDPLLRAADAAAYLGITPRHLRRQVQQGRIVAVRIGPTGRPRFRRSDLERLLTTSAAPQPDDLMSFITTTIKPG